MIFITEDGYEADPCLFCGEEVVRVENGCCVVEGVTMGQLFHWHTKCEKNWKKVRELENKYCELVEEEVKLLNYNQLKANREPGFTHYEVLRRFHPKLWEKALKELKLII